MGESFEQEDLKLISGNMQCYVIKDFSSIEKMHDENPGFDKRQLKDICSLYGFPITIILEKQYTDRMYRDAYYTYYSHLHFDMPRHCQRLALFAGEFRFYEFFDNDEYERLEDSLIGTIVIRPSYARDSEYTIGRTLLDPAKLTNSKHLYIRTADFKAIICGHKYTINAFPFSNQMGDMLRCAETSVWALLEYYGTRYDMYRTILPSMILNWESAEMAQRSLPSEGMTYSQISGMLKTFGFEPLIYVRDIYNAESFTGQTYADVSVLPKSDEQLSQEIPVEDDTLLQLEINAIEKDQAILNSRKASLPPVDKSRRLPFANFFYYYIESGLPLISAICNERESVNHSIIVIGHYERSPYRTTRESIQQNSFKIGCLDCIDSASFYERYVTIDDNQYPYRVERYDHFSVNQNCKVKAFIVPLYKHILLRAEDAVSIIEAWVKEFQCQIRDTLLLLKEIYKNEQEDASQDSIILRYFLTTSRGLADFRNRNTEYIEEKIYYANTSFPKFVWIGEISTYDLYNKGIAFGEIILDATAPRYSGSGAIISVRIGGDCAGRETDEDPLVIRRKLEERDMLSIAFSFKMYTNNLQKGDF